MPAAAHANAGVMVCDRAGRIVSTNAGLRELVARLSGPGETLRLTAASLHDDGSHVVIEVRADDPPSAGHGGPALRIYSLGSLRVEARAGPLSGPWLENRPGQLLRLLLCERHRLVPTDAIAEAIWPRAGAAAPNRVRQFVHALRVELEPDRSRGAPSSAIVHGRGGYGLHREHVWIDADEFTLEAGAGMDALAAGDRSRASAHLTRALALYEGDFLSDEPYAEWALAERERLRRIACDALRALADIRADHPAAAAACLERLAQMEPFDSDVQRALILTWLRLGRQSRAVRHYHSFRLRLLREFGERPDFELSALMASAA